MLDPEPVPDMRYFTGDPVMALLPALSVEQQALVTDDAAYGTDAKEDIVQQHIVWAESTADAYAGARYPGLSLLTAPPAYKKAILVIAKKSLLARRDYTTAVLDAEYNDALRWLRDIYEDRADLSPDPNDPTGSGSTGDNPGEVNFGFATPGPVFRDGFSA